MEEKQSDSYNNITVQNDRDPLGILSSVASDLLIIDNPGEIFDYTAQILHQVIAGCIVIVNTYNPADKSLSVHTIRGVRPFITQITSILGYNPLLTRYKTMNVSDNLLRKPNNTLYEIKGGLPELTFGKINSVQANRIHEILKINGIFGTGLVFGDEVFGSVSILLKDKDFRNKQLVESIIRLSSNALYRAKSHHEFLQSQQKLHNIINKMAEGVLHITQGGNILYANKNTCDMVEYTIEELEKMSVYDFVKDKKRLKTLSYQIWQQSTEIRNDFQVQIITRSGQSKWLHVKGNKLTDEAGIENGYLAILSDITESKKHEAIQKELDIVRGTARLKEQFLANISHEMLTPLNGVSGLTEILLESDEISSKNKEIVSIINDSSRQLHRIIDDILRFTRIEKGFMKYEPRLFDLGALLDHNYLLFSASAKQKNIEVILEYHGRENVYLMGDDVKINQVLSNLLGNAVKFTPQNGTIRFTTHLVEHSKDKVFLRFDIDDNGIGVEPQKQQSIFEDFELGDGSTTREHDGLGLGLSISRKLVQMMMGKIVYEEKDEPGARFWFEVPVVVTKSDGKEKENHACTETPDRSSSVMVFENKPIQQKIMQVILEKNNFDSCFVKVMDDLDKKIPDDKEFSFILFHPRFPKLDLQKVRDLLKQKFGKHIPLIAVDEASICVDFIENQMHLVDDFFPPPYSSEYLSFLVDKHKITRDVA